MPQNIQPAAVPGLLRPGMRVYVQGASSEPLSLLEALEAAPEAAAGVDFVHIFTPGMNRRDLAGLHADARATAFFITADVGDSYRAGKIAFLPLNYSGVHLYFAEDAQIDLAFIQVSPPDADGNCRLGVSVDFVPVLIERGVTLVAEVNAQMPAAPGSPSVPYRRLDHVVETDHPLVEMPEGRISDAVAMLGRHVADLIEDGDTIQIGIGSVPAAIMANLGDKRDLGLQGGMITDGIMHLMEAGVLTGAKKSIDRGAAVCGISVGSRVLYDWAGGRPDVLFRPASYTHDVRTVAQLDNFVSINSTLEIDLFGQANSETIAGRQISGTGGLMDFVRAARMARNGRSILALTATAARGTVSRIVPHLPADAIVSCARSDIDIVVTEHGIARLRDKGLDQRAEALIAIAEPSFRDGLANDWTAMRRAAS